MRNAVRRATVLATASVLATTGVGAVSQSAWAGSDESIGTLRGVVSWYSHGDKIEVADIKKDGLSIEANYELRTGGGGMKVLHVAGRGKRKSRVWDLREGTDIRIRMCYRDGWVVTACSRWQYAEA